MELLPEHALPPVPMSRLEHYAAQDEIGLRYNSHRIKPVDEW